MNADPSDMTSSSEATEQINGRDSNYNGLCGDVGEELFLITIHMILCQIRSMNNAFFRTMRISSSVRRDFDLLRLKVLSRQ